MSKILNKFSKIITQPKNRGAAQAMLYALGLSPNDLNKPQIGVCSMWYDGNPCNSKLNIIQDKIKCSISKTKQIPMRFNTIGVSDGMSMGTFGMRYSLPSRELIADSIETIMSAQHYDGLVCIPGCDKNLPGSVMGMMRLNRPSCVVYGGSMRPQNHNGNTLDIVSAFESFGSYLKGDINDKERQSIVENSCDSKQCGSCSGFYTANTMACLIEVMGLSLPNSSSNMSLSKEKFNECDEIGSIMKHLIENDIRPRDIVTKKSLENAIRMLYAIGGSTNAIIHILAIAQEANIDFSVEDCKKWEHIPVLTNMKPHGIYCMSDLNKIGGTSVLCKYLIEEGILDGSTQTITGKSLWDNVSGYKSLFINDVHHNDDKSIVPVRHCSQNQIINSTKSPFKRDSHIKILKGLLAPNGCISKIYSEHHEFNGRAIVFNSEDEMLNSLQNGNIKKDHFIILRYQGESIGCPEMLAPTSALVGYFGNEQPPPLATDGRFSGGSKGILVAHLPDAYKNGSPTALIEDDDIITVSTVNNTIEICVDPEKLKRRKPKNVPPILQNKGYLNKFNKLVGSIESGYSTT